MKKTGDGARAARDAVADAPILGMLAFPPMSGWTFPLPPRAIARVLIREAVKATGSRHAAAYHANCAGVRVRCVVQPVPFQTRTRVVTRRDVDAVMSDSDAHIAFVEAA